MASTGAENYVEQHVHDRETGERYTLTIQRPGKKTPHELRGEAERQVDVARELIGTVRVIAETWRDDPGVYPDGAAEPMEQIATVLLGHRGQRRTTVTRPYPTEVGEATR